MVDIVPGGCRFERVAREAYAAPHGSNRPDRTDQVMPARV